VATICVNLRIVPRKSARLGRKTLITTLIYAEEEYFIVKEGNKKIPNSLILHKHF
jgi:hypothetical protein